MDIKISIENATPEEVAQVMKNVADHANSGSQGILKVETKLGDVNLQRSAATDAAIEKEEKTAPAKRSHKKKVEPAKPAKTEAEDEDEDDGDEDEDEKPVKGKSKKPAADDEDEDDGDEDEDEKSAKSKGKVELDQNPKKVTIETIRKAAGILAKAGMAEITETVLEFYDYETIPDISKDDYEPFYARLIKRVNKAQA